MLRQAPVAHLGPRDIAATCRKLSPSFGANDLFAEVPGANRLLPRPSQELGKPLIARKSENKNFPSQTFSLSRPFLGASWGAVVGFQGVQLFVLFIQSFLGKVNYENEGLHRNLGGLSPAGEQESCTPQDGATWLPGATQGGNGSENRRGRRDSFSPCVRPDHRAGRRQGQQVARCTRGRQEPIWK